ncbi:MAG: hypothetical protein AB8G15_16205 [Saprospiraceae bacterium]
MTNKSLLAILGILVLGFAMGFLTAGYFTKKHVRHIHKIGTAKGFQEQFLRTVTLGTTQKEKLLPLLENYGTQFQEIHVNFKKQRATLIDDLQQELEKELNESQQESAKEFYKKLKRPRRHKKKHKKKKDHSENKKKQE